ncbi:MAG TPA: SDR family oxidoreductase [Sphingomonas sp.]|jgi:NAD(P)-dependent dehydrogenase (short-subunit alcohol dehydrogenase family)|nr:SDR family oxidoreductase [Sphingomonas sp.]
MTHLPHAGPIELKGRRAIISGGTTGIGRAIAIRLASQGAAVFVCGTNAAHLADALADIRAVGVGEGMTTDLADPDNVARFFDAGEQAMGGFDIAVINAAIGAGGLTQISEPDLRHVIALDFTAYLLCAHAAAARMRKGVALGDIVLMGSMSAHVLGPSSTVYAGIKAGVAGFSEALRRELGPKGIRVALVEPGKTGSDMLKADVPEEEQRAQIARDEMLCAEDIAAGVEFLLTQPSRSVIQQIVIVPRAQEGE